MQAVKEQNVQAPAGKVGAYPAPARARPFSTPPRCAGGW
jgi:hypothetical protein